VRVHQQVGDVGVGVKGAAHVAQQAGADDAAGTPDAGDARKRQAPAVFAVGCAHQGKALCVGADLGGQQGMADFRQQAGGVLAGLRCGAGQHGRGRHALGLDGADGASEHGVGDGGRGHAQVQRHLAGPFTGAFLLGRVQDPVDQRIAGLGVLRGQDIGSDADQVALQFALVPFAEDGAALRGRHAQQVLHQPPGLADHLHVGVFDAVVHHLHKVAGATRTHPVAAGLAVVGLGGNRLQHGGHQRPGLGRAAGHQGRAAQGAFFAAAHARADIQNAAALQAGDAARGVGIQRVAAVDEHIARRQQRAQVGQHRVHGGPGRHHQQNPARCLQAGHQCGQVVGHAGLQASCALRKLLALAGVEVETADGKTVALKVQGEVLAHHAQADQAQAHRLRGAHQGLSMRRETEPAGGGLSAIRSTGEVPCAAGPQNFPENGPLRCPQRTCPKLWIKG